MIFSPGEIEFYSRHMLLKGVGIKGQEKLKQAKVLVIGAGGLGSPAMLYLASAGVGKLGIVDFDRVETNNLHRQILYNFKDMGKNKTEVAARKLKGLNPYVKIKTYPIKLTRENALEVLKDYDIIIDGSDNFPTRYLVNDACFFLSKPDIYASIFQFEGQIAVFYPKKSGPCYRCLYPSPPPPHLVQSCAEVGVLGVLPGIIGSIQAQEAIKIILEYDEILVGRMFTYNALKAELKEVKLVKNPNCPLCGNNPTISSLINYEEFCGIRAQGEDIVKITPEELQEKLQKGENLLIIDVRREEEYELGHVQGAKNISHEKILYHLETLDPKCEIVLYCKTENRSCYAAEVLKKLNFPRVKVLAGGIDNFRKKIDPSLPPY